MCEGCEKRIVNALSDVKNIKDVQADHKEGKVVIKSKKDVDMEVVKEKIENLGFKVKE